MYVTIYIPKKKEQIWKQIEAEAEKEERGIGFYICEKFDKIVNKKDLFEE